MSTLKEKFDDYSVQPDEKVWTSIQDTLRQRAAVARRRRIAVAATTVAASAVVIALVFGRKTATPIAPTMQQSVQTASAVVPEVAVDENATAVPQTLPVKENTSLSSSQPVETQPVATASEPSVQPANDVAAATSPATVTAPAVNNAVESKAAASSTRTGSEETEVAATALPEVNDEEPAPTQQQQKVSRPTQKVPAQELAIWIPNAFSPDDPDNETVRTFKVSPNNGSNILSFEMYIYSRTGRQVFHARDINQGWDGTAKGQKQPMGTYVYLIELYDAVKGLQQQKGTITLIR